MSKKRKKFIKVDIKAVVELSFLRANQCLFTAGVIVAIIGFIVLLCIIPVYRKSHPKKEAKPINWSIVLTWTIGVVGSLIMGFGMSKILVGEVTTAEMLVGIITGVVGLIICVLNYPIYDYIKGNKE